VAKSCNSWLKETEHFNLLTFFRRFQPVSYKQIAPQRQFKAISFSWSYAGLP